MSSSLLRGVRAVGKKSERQLSGVVVRRKEGKRFWIDEMRKEEDRKGVGGE